MLEHHISERPLFLFWASKCPRSHYFCTIPAGSTYPILPVLGLQILDIPYSCIGPSDNPDPIIPMLGLQIIRDLCWSFRYQGSHYSFAKNPDTIDPHYCSYTEFPNTRDYVILVLGLQKTDQMYSCNGAPWYLGL